MIVNCWDFLFLSCQHPGNFIPANHHDRQKFLIDCVIPYLWISVGTEKIDKQTIWKRILCFYQDSTLKIHDTARRMIWPWKRTVKQWYYIWYHANILSILFGTYRIWPHCSFVLSFHTEFSIFKKNKAIYITKDKCHVAYFIWRLYFFPNTWKF